MGVLARYGEGPRRRSRRARGRVTRCDDQRRLGGLPDTRRVDLAVRKAERVFLVVTIGVPTVVLTCVVIFKVRVESGCGMRFVARADLAKMRWCRVVLVEMGKRSEDGEEDERSDLETGNQDRKQSATHGALLSSALLPKST